MILAVKGYRDLREWWTAVKEGGFDVPRPDRCPGPQRCLQGLWKHTSYSRSVIDRGGERREVEIKRYRCPACGLTVSCLMDFLVPYLLFTVQSITGLVEQYLREPATYEGLAWDRDGEGLSSKSSIFRWVGRVAAKGGELGAAVQQEAVLSRVENAMVEVAPMVCPNAVRARKPGKQAELNEAAGCLALSEQLLARRLFAEDSLLTTLQRYFLVAAEKVWSILTGRKSLRLSAQQSVRYLIF